MCSLNVLTSACVQCFHISAAYGLKSVWPNQTGTTMDWGFASNGGPVWFTTLVASDDPPLSVSLARPSVCVPNFQRYQMLGTLGAAHGPRLIGWGKPLIAKEQETSCCGVGGRCPVQLKDSGGRALLRLSRTLEGRRSRWTHVKSGTGFHWPRRTLASCTLWFQKEQFVSCENSAFDYVIRQHYSMTQLRTGRSIVVYISDTLCWVAYF